MSLGLCGEELLRAGVTPAGDFFQAIGAGLLEEADAVAGVLEFVDIGPDFGLPGVVVDRGLAAGGAAGVELQRGGDGRASRAGVR